MTEGVTLHTVTNKAILRVLREEPVPTLALRAKLRRIRVSHFIPCWRLAEIAGVSAPTVTGWELNYCKNNLNVRVWITALNIAIAEQRPSYRTHKIHSLPPNVPHHQAG